MIRLPRTCSFICSTLNHIFKAYEPYKGDISTSRKGCLIATQNGEASAYGIMPLQARGTMFIRPGDKGWNCASSRPSVARYTHLCADLTSFFLVYQGMIVGESSKTDDLDINPTKTKA